MKTLYVSDLDGTLLGTDGRVSPRSAAMVSRLSHGGSLISVATARTPASVEPLLCHTYTAIPAVVMTGAALWDRQARQYINRRPLHGDTARELHEIVSSEGLKPFVYTFYPGDPLLHVWCRTPFIDAEADFIEQRRQMELKIFHIDEPMQPGADVMLLMTIGPADRIFRAAEKVRRHGGCSVSAFTDIYGPEIGFLEIFAPGVDKASAVKELQGLAGADRLVVYGDNLNDLSMMAVADEAVAVANAVEAVKGAADRIIGPNSSDAVALDIARLEGALNNLQNSPQGPTNLFFYDY